MALFFGDLSQSENFLRLSYQQISKWYAQFHRSIFMPSRFIISIPFFVNCDRVFKSLPLFCLPGFFQGLRRRPLCNQGSLYLIMTLHFHFVFQNCDGEGSFKKGLLWQQRDKLFSRWKERYFILTKDYFHCFKKASSRITEMGGFIFKVSVLHTFLLAFIFVMHLRRT